MKYIFMLLSMLSVSPAVMAAEWAGKPPDCWKDARNFHRDSEQDPWKKNVKISRVQAPAPAPGTMSPNNGYYFVAEPDARPAAKVTVYTEKKYLVQITFDNPFRLAETGWVNENLLFIRSWWGRTMGTDMILDVEKEKIVYAETVHDGTMQYQHFQEVCQQVGSCECVKKAAKPGGKFSR